ncbi:MAG: iron-containing alcohol dehydrogenase [Spirochaetales bacterium]|nr:iron-containing alcohol dehydrogenase [Spirochaetales bacterium]
MSYSFQTAGNIIVGRDKRREIPLICSGFGKRILFVTGRRTVFLDEMIPEFLKLGCTVIAFQVETEPTTGIIERGLEIARKHRCDVIAAVGGGSVIDTAKALAVLVPNSGTLMDHLEVIGDAVPLEKQKIPLVVAPTTAGTGAEATCNAVIRSKKHKVKVSLRSVNMFPSCVVIDPVCTRSMTPELTAFSGFDAMTQLIESYLSKNANPITDALCIEGLRKVHDSFFKAYQDGTDIQAREEMCVASLLSGMALANSKLGAVHGIAGPLGGMIDAPHGGICAALLGPVMIKNIARIQKDHISDAALRVNIISQVLFDASKDHSDNLVSGIKDLARKMKIPGLGSCGFSDADYTELADKALRASSMKGNPVELNTEELFEIFTMAL